MLKNNRTNSAEWVIENGWLTDAEIQPSSHFEPRDKNESISLLVVHNISLPPGQFGGNYITDFFSWPFRSNNRSLF